MALEAASSYAGSGMYHGSGMYTGQGGYSNHLVAGGTDGSPPRFASEMDEEGALVITHREFVRDVYGNPTGVTFQNAAAYINPGLSSTFPWLSQLAANYEEYEMHQLMFVYEAKISENATSTDGQLGSIIMFTDYGADSKVKTSKQQMLQGYGSQDALCTRDAVHGVECDPAKIHGDGHKYIRVRPLDQNSALTDYDLGIFQLAVSGTPTGLANQIIGQLYVQYTVKLRKPRLYSKLGYTIARDVFTYIGDSQQITNNINNSALAVIAEAQLASTYNSIGCKVEVLEDGLRDGRQTMFITFPAWFAGNIEVQLMIEIDDDASGSGNSANWATLIDKGVDVDLTADTNDIKPSGNVTLVNDIWPSGPDDTASPQYAVSIASNRGGMLTVHCAVEQADTGVDNQLQIQLQVRSSAHGNCKPSSVAQLVIQSYNNYEVDGVPPGLPTEMP